MSVSPYNPTIDEVFHVSSRTPDVSPFRHPIRQPRLFDPGLSTYSPESDVGYGTSFGSQELGAHTLDMDMISNLVVISFSSTSFKMKTLRKLAIDFLIRIK